MSSSIEQPMCPIDITALFHQHFNFTNPSLLNRVFVELDGVVTNLEQASVHNPTTNAANIPFFKRSCHFSSKLRNQLRQQALALYQLCNIHPIPLHFKVKFVHLTIRLLLLHSQLSQSHLQSLYEHFVFDPSSLHTQHPPIQYSPIKLPVSQSVVLIRAFVKCLQFSFELLDETSNNHNMNNCIEQAMGDPLISILQLFTQQLYPFFTFFCDISQITPKYPDVVFSFYFIGLKTMILSNNVHTPWVNVNSANHTMNNNTTVTPSNPSFPTILPLYANIPTYQSSNQPYDSMSYVDPSFDSNHPQAQLINNLSSIKQGFTAFQLAESAALVLLSIQQQQHEEDELKQRTAHKDEKQFQNKSQGELQFKSDHTLPVKSEPGTSDQLQQNPPTMKSQHLLPNVKQMPNSTTHPAIMNSAPTNTSYFTIPSPLFFNLQAEQNLLFDLCYQSSQGCIRENRFRSAVQWLYLSISLATALFTGHDSDNASLHENELNSSPLPTTTHENGQNDMHDDHAMRDQNGATSQRPHRFHQISRLSKLFRFLSVCFYEENRYFDATAAVSHSLSLNPNDSNLFLYVKLLFLLLGQRYCGAEFESLKTSEMRSDDIQQQQQHGRFLDQSLSERTSFIESDPFYISLRQLILPQNVFRVAYSIVSQLTSFDLCCSLFSSIPFIASNLSQQQPNSSEHDHATTNQTLSQQEQDFHNTAPFDSSIYNSTLFTQSIYKLLSIRFAQSQSHASNNVLNMMPYQTNLPWIPPKQAKLSTFPTENLANQLTINHLYLNWLLHNNLFDIALQFINSITTISEQSLHIIWLICTGLLSQQDYLNCAKWSKALLQLLHVNDYYNRIISYTIYAQSMYYLHNHQECIEFSQLGFDLVKQAQNEGYIPPCISLIIPQDQNDHVNSNSSSSSSLYNDQDDITEPLGAVKRTKHDWDGLDYDSGDDNGNNDSLDHISQSDGQMDILEQLEIRLVVLLIRSNILINNPAATLSYLKKLLLLMPSTDILCLICEEVQEFTLKSSQTAVQNGNSETPTLPDYEEIQILMFQRLISLIHVEEQLLLLIVGLIKLLTRKLIRLTGLRLNYEIPSSLHQLDKPSSTSTPISQPSQISTNSSQTPLIIETITQIYAAVQTLQKQTKTNITLDQLPAFFADLASTLSYSLSTRPPSTLCFHTSPPPITPTNPQPVPTFQTFNSQRVFSTLSIEDLIALSQCMWNTIVIASQLLLYKYTVHFLLANLHLICVIQAKVLVFNYFSPSEMDVRQTSVLDNNVNNTPSTHNDNLRNQESSMSDRVKIITTRKPVNPTTDLSLSPLQSRTKDCVPDPLSALLCPTIWSSTATLALAVFRSIILLATILENTYVPSNMLYVQSQLLKNKDSNMVDLIESEDDASEAGITTQPFSSDVSLPTQLQQLELSKSDGGTFALTILTTFQQIYSQFATFYDNLYANQGADTTSETTPPNRRGASSPTQMIDHSHSSLEIDLETTTSDVEEVEYTGVPTEATNQQLNKFHQFHFIATILLFRVYLHSPPQSNDYQGSLDIQHPFNPIPIVPREITTDCFNHLIREALQAKQYSTAQILLEYRISLISLSLSTIPPLPHNILNNFDDNSPSCPLAPTTNPQYHKPSDAALLNRVFSPLCIITLPDIVLLFHQLVLVHHHLIHSNPSGYGILRDTSSSNLNQSTMSETTSSQPTSFTHSDTSRIILVHMHKMLVLCQQYISLLEKSFSILASSITSFNIVSKQDSQPKLPNDVLQLLKHFIDFHFSQLFHTPELHTTIKLIYNIGVNLFYQWYNTDRLNPSLSLSNPPAKLQSRLNSGESKIPILSTVMEYYTAALQLRQLLLIKPYSLLHWCSTIPDDHDSRTGIMSVELNTENTNTILDIENVRPNHRGFVYAKGAKYLPKPSASLVSANSPVIFAHQQFELIDPCPEESQTIQSALDSCSKLPSGPFSSKF